VEGYDGETVIDDVATRLVVDTMTATLMGRNGECSTLMHHQIGELELEKAITTSLGYEDVRTAHESAINSNHGATCTSQAEAIGEQLTTFMSAYPTLFPDRRFTHGQNHGVHVA
jgi:hypothetical protein